MKDGKLIVGGVKAFPIDGEVKDLLAACVAAHAVFLPFKGPCSDLFALIYVSWGFVVPMKKGVQRLKDAILGDY